MEEKYLWKTFGQILSAMQECHRREGGAIMHRDLKPANIFLDKHGELLHSCPAPPVTLPGFTSDNAAPHECDSLWSAPAFN